MLMIRRKTRKKEGRKPLQNEKDKDPDIQGDGRNKRPQYGPPQVMQKQTDPEVENWKNHVKRHILQYTFINYQHLKASLQFAGQFTSGCYYCWMDNHNHQQCGKLK